MTLSEIVRRVICLSRETSERIENLQEEPLVGCLYDPLRQHLRPMKYRRALRDYLPTQSVDVIYLLTTIMYIGRRDFGRKVGINNFWRRHKEVRRRFGTPQGAMDQMIEKVPLPDYLEAGLRLLAKKGIDVDKLLQR